MNSPKIEIKWNEKSTHTQPKQSKAHQTDNEFFFFSQSAVEHNEWQDKSQQQRRQRQQQSLWYTNKSLYERELSDYESLEMYVFKRFYYYGLFFCLGFSFTCLFLILLLLLSLFIIQSVCLTFCIVERAGASVRMYDQTTHNMCECVCVFRSRYFWCM